MLVITIIYILLLLLFSVIFLMIFSIKRLILQNSQIENSKKQNLPVINLVVPCRNEEKRLHFLLNSDLSLFNEIILINDNSNDSTLRIMKDYKKKSPYRIKIFNNSKQFSNMINSKAAILEFFQGKYSSNCEYIFFCDADVRFSAINEFFSKFKFEKNVTYTFLPKYKVIYWWEKIWLPLFLALCFLEYKFYNPNDHGVIIGFAWMIHKEKLKYAFSPLDVKKFIVEDYAMSENLIQNRIPIKTLDGRPFLSISCYENMKHFLNTSAKGYQQLPYLQRFFIFLTAFIFNFLVFSNFIILISSLINFKPIILFLSLSFYLFLTFIFYQTSQWIEMKRRWLFLGFLGALLYLIVSLKFLLSKEIIWRGRKIVPTMA